MIERIRLRRASFCYMLVLAVLFVGGCAGPKPRENERTATVERSYKPEASPVSGGQDKKVFISTPSGKEKGDIGQQGSDTTRPIPVQVPAALPTPESGTAKAKPATKPQPTPPVLSLADKPGEKKVAADRGPKVVLNFDNADLYAVISTIGELLGINYIVAPSVAGKVTINTAGGLYKKDLFPIFLKILEVNGLTAIKEGNLYKIVETKDSPRMPLELRLSAGGEEVPPMDKIVIQIIPLKFISTGEMTTLITPFMSKGGTIVSDANSNTLIVIDKWLNILKALRLIETFDVNVFDKVKYRFYPLEHLEVEEMVAFLTDFTSYYEKATNVFVKFIALTRMNTLLVVTTAPHVFEKVEEILDRVDVAVEEFESKIYVYFVKNGEAEALASLLGKVFKKKSISKDKPKDKKRKAGGSATIAGNPLSAARVKEKKAEKAAAEAKAKEPAKKISAVEKGEAAGSGTLMAEIHITPDEIRNALIIEAIPSDYRIIEDILRRIDVLPRQVLIEATIAEVTRGASTELGMDWAFGKGAAGQGAGSFLATVGAAGLKYSIGVTDKWYAELNALAIKGLVNIISSPHVLASDNKEARIDVSREIPVASGQTTVVGGTVIGETTIEYRDTGVILSVTPHINDRGLVTMDISQEVSDLDEDVKVASQSYPSFFKRTVKTTLTVKHGQTIVIGGLIKDKEEEDISGVPCLIDVPVVRYLFGLETKKTKKIELIVLITPRVVANLDEVDAVTQEFKQKVRNVMNRFFPQ
ncbi:MAG: type II secretion system secretin GspD [Desulfobacteraceae bacterium]|nr:type II secretion system secretin GspD [Desulfobacteraceae bacterium]